jgi:hypothetical protein
MMRLIDKAYFTLEEIEEAWKLPGRDLAYLAENGLLRLSVRLFGVHLELGTYEEEGQGEWCRIPHERVEFTGLQDLLERDVFCLFRDGKARITRFHAPQLEFRDLIAPTDEITIRRDDVVIRKEERDRLEAKHGLARGQSTTSSSPAFEVINDYREIRLPGLTLNLGWVQSRIVKLLHQRATSGNPWLDGKTILFEAGSASSRMIDVFKSQSHWRRLIESDRRGRYRPRQPSR